MIHEAWDTYAANDIAPGDLVVFADGPADRPPRSFTVEAARSRAERQKRASPVTKNRRGSP